MTRVSTSLIPPFSTAFATADLRSFWTGRAAFLRVNPKILSAWLTLFPRTVSTTIRTLRGEMRMCVAVAFIATFLYAISRLVFYSISALLYALSYHYGHGRSGLAKILPVYALPCFQ